MVGLVAAIVIFAPGKKTYVVEASGNIPPLAQVTNSDLKAVPLPLGDIQSGAFTGTSSSSAITSALKSIGNQEAAYPIAQGQQLSASLFNSPQVQTTPIPPNYRLMSISAATSTSVGGTLRPGNVVDVISIESVDSKTYAVVVASGVQVVAVSTTSAAVPTSSTKNSNGTSSTNASASSSSTGVYVLKVPIPQVLNMTLGDSQGKIYLALQGPGANPLPQLPVSVQQQVCANSNSTVTVPGALTTSDCPLP
jgi:Flp pilus assembly protein CpaB